MNPLSQIAKSLVRKSGEASTAPFYSAIDKSLSSLPNKALGDQFIKEMLKSGVKPQEIIDRNIDVALGSPIVRKTRTVKLKKPDKKGRTEIEEKYFEVTPSAKGSKAIKREDVERIAAENPAPAITEKIEKGPSEVKYKVEHDDLNDRYDVVDDYSNVVKSFRDYDDAESYATNLTGGTTRYEQWQLPGGKNYREIKLMLPLNKLYEKVDQLTEQAKRLDQKAASAWSEHGNLEEFRRLSGEARDLRLQANSIEKDIKDETFKYQSRHFDEPNILAHARVSDRTGPNGEKILHVEEIQSDWHQTGRKKGYQSSDLSKIQNEFENYSKELADKYNLNPAQNLAMYGTIKRMQPEEVAKYEQLQSDWIKAKEGVPEAPFKQNWHELVMKRLLDDAAKNGYDKVIITPGAEQAKRYDLSKHVEELNYKKNADGTYQLSAQAGGRGNMIGEAIDESELERHVGKDVAQKIINNEGFDRNFGGNGSVSQPKDIWKGLSGLDLQVGGEGMRGFYDQMLPAFLNDYGKKWGVRVGQYEIYPYEMAEKRKELINNLIKQGHTPESAEKQALGIYPEKEPSILLHSFDITPQMREDIVGKGQPLYQAIPAGVGAGTLAAPQEEVTDQPMKKGGAVHLSQGGEPETPEQQFEHYLRMLRINASGGKDKYGSSVGGRFGVNIPIAKDIFIEPFVQGFVFKPDTGKLMSGGVGGANLNISFKNGGNVSEDAMRLAVLNKKIQHKAGGGKMEVLKAIGRGLRGMREPKNQTNIIKEGGGNWLAGNVEGALKPLKREGVSVMPLNEAELANYKAQGYTVYNADTGTYSKPDPLNQWVDKQLTRYIKNQMGTKEDPIRLSAEKNNIHMPTYEIYDPSNSKLMQKRLAAGMPVKNIGKSETARNWENIVDRSIYPNSAGSYVHGSLDPDILKNNPWLTKINPETEVYYATGLRRDLGLDHLVDELRNATNPSSGLPRELLIKPESLSKLSVQQAVERVAKINEWRAAQKAEADLLRARNPATVLHKEYPEGYSWYELKNPEGAKNTSALEDALKYEGEQMGHCVGAYCPDVAEGRSRIYSLRDKKGQPHVTIEVKPQKQSDVDSIEWINENAARGALEAGEINNLNDWKDASQEVKDWYLDLAKKSFDAEFKPNLLPPSIIQIKGKANLAPKEEYLPFVQDFVRSGNWSDVRDLQNTGLMRVDLLKKAGWDLGDINKEYLTKQEFEDIKRGMDNSMKPPYGSTDEGMKRGGFIKFDNKNIDAMRMAVMNKQLRKRHG